MAAVAVWVAIPRPSALARAGGSRHPCRSTRQNRRRRFATSRRITRRPNRWSAVARIVPGAGPIESMPPTDTGDARAAGDVGASPTPAGAARCSYGGIDRTGLGSRTVPSRCDTEMEKARVRILPTARADREVHPDSELASAQRPVAPSRRRQLASTARP